jgi:hypothetical protein
MNRSNHTGSITRINDHIDHRNIANLDSTTQESLRTKAMRLMLSSEAERAESNHGA